MPSADVVRLRERLRAAGYELQELPIKESRWPDGYVTVGWRVVAYHGDGGPYAAKVVALWLSDALHQLSRELLPDCA